MIGSIFLPEISVLEKIVRPLIVYIFLLVAFRVVGKRELGQLTPFDLVVLLTISNVLQNAMIGPDNSLGGGLIGGLTLFVANGVIVRLSIRFPRLLRLIESRPTLLIKNGKVIRNNLKREGMTYVELERALRKHDLDPSRDIALIRQALLEVDGTVTVVRETNA